MSGLQTKMVNSTFWSILESFSNQGIQFILGIILARLLLPEDYGLTSVITILLVVAAVLVDSGFKSSIIRSKDLSESDCSTIFYLNLFISIIVSASIYGLSEYISMYFKKPELSSVTKVFSLIPVINGLGLVQSALLFKNLQIKRNTYFSIISNALSGCIAIVLALKGFSYWSLVWKSVLSAAIYNSLLWINSKWYPKLKFSLDSFNKHFSYSYKLLLTGLINSVFNNLYSIIFGRFFSFKELGFFTRGQGYVDMISRTLSIAIQKVNIPLLAEASKHDSVFNSYIKLLRATGIIIFPCITFLIAISEPMITVLIGEKWLPAVPYLKILAMSGMIYPIYNANVSLFEVLGRSDLSLKLTIIQRPVQIIILLITSNIGPISVAWGILLHYIFIFCFSFYLIKATLSVSVVKILKALKEPFYMSIILGTLVYLLGLILKSLINNGVILCLQLVFGVILAILLFRIFRIQELQLIEKILLEKFNSFFQKKFRNP